jgi:hypothetical protein
MDEIKICAQEKINKRMNNDVNYKPHNLVLNGNAAFVPAWFSQASLAPVATVASMSTTVAALPSSPAPAPAPSVTPPKPPAATAAPAVAAAPVVAPAPVAVPPVVVPPPTPVALTGEQSLRQMFDQRDAKRRIQVTTANAKLKIGQDALDFAVQSDRAGFVYVALAGSDNKSVYLLFPNDLDQNNKIEAGQQILLPRPNWRVKAAGPAGMDNLLVMVSDGPRDLSTLSASKAGPFVSSLNDAQGRAKLGALMTTSQMVSSQSCTTPAARKNNPQCSDAYGASMLTLEEIK